MLLNCGVEKTLESPLDFKDIQPVHSKKDQPWDFFGRNDANAETPVLWPPHAKSWLIGKDPDAGRDWRQEENGTTEEEMAGWHHWLNGRESEWTPGVGDGQGGLVCCDSWGPRELDTTEWLNWTELNCFIPYSKAKFAYYSRCFLTSYFCIPVPYNEKDIFFWVLVLKGLVGLHRTVKLQVLQRYWLGHRLGLLWYWMVCLGNEQRSFCRFWDCMQVLHFRLFCWPWWLLHFF